MKKINKISNILYMDSLNLVPLKNNLLKDHIINELKSRIITRIMSLNLHDSKYRLDQELLILITTSIEFLAKKKDKLDKKTICLDILIQLFNLSIEEQEIIKKNIDFIHGNKMIKKPSFYKIFSCGINEWFKKKA